MKVCQTEECQACGEAGGTPAGGNRNRSPVRISSWLEPADELTWLGAGLSRALGGSRCGVQGTERDGTSTRTRAERGDSRPESAGGGGADSGGSSGRRSASPAPGAPSSSLTLLQLNALREDKARCEDGMHSSRG